MAWEFDEEDPRTQPTEGEVHGYTEQEVMNLIVSHAGAHMRATVAEADVADLKGIIREALRVLHKTNVSKKAIADRMRVALGMLPGEPLRD